MFRFKANSTIYATITPKPHTNDSSPPAANPTD